MKIGITGASGKLGHLVLEQLLRRTEGTEIVALARSPEKLASFEARGVEIREANYSIPKTLEPALSGLDRLLLISSSELLNDRAKQHHNVIQAAVHANVRLIVYTSVLRADQTSVSVLQEHRQTEAELQASGIPYVILRNGWYIENYTENLPTLLSQGTLYGAAGDGKIAAASREDYAAAAARVLLEDGHAGKTYELAGSYQFTKADIAEAVSSWYHKDIQYKNLTPNEYSSALEGAGLPGPIAQFLVEADIAIAHNELSGSGDDLSFLIGRSSRSLDDVLGAQFSS